MPVCPKLASSALFYSDLTCDVAFLPTDDIIKRRAQSLAKLFKRNLAIRQALFNSKPKGSKDFEIKHFGGRGGDFKPVLVISAGKEVKTQSVHVCNLYSEMKNKKKRNMKNKQKQLCSFLFFNASGFSVHTVDCTCDRWTGGLC